MQQYKSARQCTDGFRATQNDLVLQRVLAPSVIWTHAHSLTATCLKHWDIASYWDSLSHNLELIFCMQDCPARGMSLWKVSCEAFIFSCIFEKSGKNYATDLVVTQLWGSAIAVISAHLPGQHTWASAGPDPSSSTPKQCKLNGCVKIYNSVSARSPLTKSKKKIFIERAAISKRECQCTDWLNAMQNGRGTAECFITHQESNP